MYRGTTPTITCVLDTTLDMSSITDIFVTFKTAYHQIDVGKEDISISSSEKKLSMTLTEEQTLELQANDECKVQIKFMLENGMKYATNIQTLKVNEILNETPFEQESDVDGTN